MKPNYFIIRYAEIGIKGANRRFFQNLLIKNIRTALKGQSYNSIKLSFSKVLLKLDPKSDPQKIKESLERVFGIENFSPAFSCKTNYKEMEKTAKVVATKNKAKTFRITANRSWKGFPLTSQELNSKLGRAVANLGMKVNLKKPGLNIEVDILKEKSFIFTERLKGPGGLPVGSAGKLVSLLSGGIDSPVSSYLMMKRGCEVIFVHFWNEVLSGKGKMEELMKALATWQPNTRLIIIPFSDIQNQVIAKVPAKWRIILYRRMMLRIAEKLAKKETAKALVVGNALSQVSSQTLDNIVAIEEAVDMPVFSPLIGFDKQEIVELAKKIGTYSISIKPYQDCCSFMVAKHPVTKADYETVKRIEKNIPVRKLVEKSVKNMQSLKIN